jgi:hypothetical protein
MARIKKVKIGTEALTLSELLFKVEMRDNPRRTNSEYSKVVVGTIFQDDFRGELEVDLNYCSPRYELVPNSEIFPEIKRVLNENEVEYTVTYSHLNFARFYVDYVITDARYAYRIKSSKGDIIQPMLRVQHSYNGLTKYKITFGYFRLVCTNGLSIPVQEMNEFNLCIVGKHTDSIKHSFKKLDVMLKLFVNDAKQITESITAKYELLGGRMITNVEDRITEVLEASGIIAVETKGFNSVEDIKTRINKETYLYNGQVNEWLIYNGINSYINDDSRNIAAPEKRQETDSKVLEYMLTTC